MNTIAVKYIDTSTYNVEVWADDYTDSPATWGNFELVQFKDRDLMNHGSIDEYCTESGKLLPAIQSKIRAGKIFTFTYNRYSNADGGCYRYPSNELNLDDIDGFIIFDDEYIKGTNYEERKRYATGDLSEYTQWANGEVYGVTITDATGEEVDSCGGFIGDYAVKSFVAETIPDAQDDNVTITGTYRDGSHYDVYFGYNDCLTTREQ